MKSRMLGAMIGVAFACSYAGFAQQTAPLYTNNFEKAVVDKVPDDITVLDGGFAVKEEQGNKFLELPGAPLDSYGVLFGPTERDGMLASARIYSTAKTRRFPTFALGVMGVGGYRLQVAPTKKSLELYRNDTLKATQPYQWEPGKWTYLRLQARKASDGWHIEGKVWAEDKPQPKTWTISVVDTQDVPAGRASVFASPFSGTPIRFDDLAVSSPRTTE